MNRTFIYNEKGIICHPAEDHCCPSRTAELPYSACSNYTKAHDRYGISMFKFTPRKTITIEEQMSRPNTYTMSFCMSERMEFSFSGSRSLCIENNESCIIAPETQSCISTYEEGQEYSAVGISFAPSFLRGIAQNAKYESAVNTCRDLSNHFKRYVITPRAKGILMEMASCHIAGGLRDLFIEAKALELIVIFINEMMCQREKGFADTSLSKEDMSALYRARELLDKTYVHPFTLSQLSKRVYLNDYKLKNGFKQCFGKTVYSYILEKRMALAKELIGQQRFKISDIAGLAGYENTSHFITAFQKQYGITPGKLAKGDVTRSHEFSVS